MAKRKEKTPMQQAIAYLFEVGACDATEEQVGEAAEKFGVEAWQLEGYYFDAVAEIEAE